jgi:hypothetical protein
MECLSSPKESTHLLKGSRSHDVDLNHSGRLCMCVHACLCVFACVHACVSQDGTQGLVHASQMLYH